MRQSAPGIHPGVFLVEALEELGLSQASFARAVGVSAMRISHVVKGTRPVTAELALLFGKAFGQSPQYWLNLQSHHDLARAERTLGAKLGAVEVYSEGRIREFEKANAIPAAMERRMEAYLKKSRKKLRAVEHAIKESKS